ncbi:hypothetical protein DIS24_g8556 [Lasiodiplodia hormozganensis]|uniref:Uncharacterized protein n=1 Tax=Lasiodiplodia hormozganensis TaxID=869390 RepID=A0AA39Y2G7_9PEZI|nr:hypothetical protein DIS24_g8556 [Lasiodiplodia hormozganensis]
MAVSTISSTPPLFDRSNTFLDSFVPSNRDSRQPAPKRQLFPQLDSSEATPSENGSVYDAKHVCSEDEADEPPKKRPRSRRRSHSRSLSGQEWPPSGIANGPGVAVRFINRPDATPLTTIIEQKSIATLRSAVNGISATRVNRWAEAPEQKQSGGGHAGRRQAALTIDEATLRELHEIIDSQRPPDQRVSSGSGTGYVNDVEHPARPISPPQSPPVRAQTPCGLPRWPGDLPTSFGAPHRRVSRVRSFGYALRHFFRGPRGELGGRDPGNQTAMRGVHEVQQWRQWPHANQADRAAGLAFWAPPSSGHGSSNPPGWHIFEPDVHEPVTEIDAPDSPAPETPPRFHARNGTRGQDSTQHGPRQLQDRQGPMQASMPGSAPPNVAQPVRGQASKRPLTPTRRRQERLPAEDPGRTESPDSVYSTPTQTSRHSSHPLIPAPLFTSPPHSRRRLDPRIPVSPYDRLADVLSTGQPTSRDTPSRSHKERNRDDIDVRYTADDIPVYRPDAVSLRSLDNKHAGAHRTVSVASSTLASTCPTPAAASSVTQTSTPATQCTSFGGSSASTIVSASPLILKPESQPQTKQSPSDSALDSSPPSMGLTLQKESSALVSLLAL